MHFSRQLFAIFFISVLLLLNGCGEGLPSGGVKTVGEKLIAPKNFVVRQQNQSNVLSWDQIAGLTYTIYWSTAPLVPTTGSQRLDKATSPYTHNKLTNGTTYYYVIRASLDQKISPVSDTVNATPSSFAALSRPENFRVESSNQINTLSWNKVVGAENYRIYWTTDATENPLQSANPSIETPVESYIHRDLQNDVEYFYVVTALAFEGESEATEKKRGVPNFLMPGIPSNLIITNFSENSVAIEWNAAENATQYKVYWKIDDPDFSIVNTPFEELQPGDTSFILRGLARGKVYYLKVVGVNGGGVGLPSDALRVDFSSSSGGTDLSIIPPQNISADLQGINAKLAWETGSDLYVYQIYYATEPGIKKENYSTLENGSRSKILTKPSYEMDNLLVGRTYYLVIYALLGDKQSVASAELSYLVPIPEATFNNSNIGHGGKLYTQWWLGLDNSVINPVWQDAAVDSSGKKINPAQGRDTWRCAECHGWDYRGKDGEYGVGSSNFTGFPGLLDAANNKTKEEIYAFIRHGITTNNRSHSFKLISQQDALDLTRFIMNEVPTTLDVWQGDAELGKTLYSKKSVLGNACDDNGCHKERSSLVNEKKLLRESALAQPARFIHYARFGVGRMPGGQSLESARHVMSFLWQESLTDISSNFQQSAFDKVATELYDQWASGGLLYDRWWKAIKVEKNPQPTGNHPLWPAGDTVVNGTDTWRCKECHGWDYLGNKGAYGKGKHFTGITGIVGPGAETKLSAKEIYDFIRTGSQHAFTQFLSDEDIYALTRFVMQMRNEAANEGGTPGLIDEKKAEPLIFSASLGESLYNDSVAFGGCINCHTVNETKWFFNDNDPERNVLQTLDGIAKENPWEFLHKIRFGHPGSEMKGIVQFQSIKPEQAIDILGYAQTALAPNIKRGGRLYDNWWLENGLDQPTEAHPLWPTETIGIRAEETWRCVSCHGWSYTGESGIKGLVNLTRNAQAFIEGGTYLNEADHAFVKQLKRQDIYDLAKFINTEENTGVRSDIDLLIANADAVAGKSLYIGITPGNCINCHGESGTSIANIDLETAAKNFTARFVHKVRFGSPDSIMLPSLEKFKGLTAVQAADVHAYGLAIASSTSLTEAGLDRGGRLFDNWFKEMKTSDITVQDPVLINPLWESRKTGIPDVQSLSDSWRCVSCHSWNYKGIDLLKTDSDADDLLRKLAVRRIDYPNQVDLANYFYNWIKNGSGGLHNYGMEESGLLTVLGDRELKELAAFITQGIINTSEYIYNIDGKVIKSNVNNGKALYQGKLLPDIVCVSCHGENGDSIPPGGSVSVDIFALAKNNPWQFLHKVRFASSGTDMPSLVGLPGTNIQQALDVLGFAQAEFAKRQ